jgi:hypothetical protein
VLRLAINGIVWKYPRSAEGPGTLTRVLTIFTVPKPFRGRVGDIQRNAIESWLALGNDVQIVLVGDEEGVEESARAAGVEHIGGLAQNERGTPRLDSAFRRVETVSKWPMWCYVNADILLLDDFLPAIDRVKNAFGDFLLIGECRDLDVPAEMPLHDSVARSQVREMALHRGRLRGYAALDYFVFRQGLFDPVPPFLIGRACFDNWLVWRARKVNRPVVDATRSVVAVHQSHDYSHVRGGLVEAYGGPEARYNEQLAGGRQHIYSLHDASHRLYSKGRPVRYLGSTLRARERARSAKAKADDRIAARRADKRFERPVRLLGVYARPSSETTAYLDTLAGATDVDLAVLYATQAQAPALSSIRAPKHVHWFPRSVRSPRIDRAIGRDYPVQWAIWRSFHALRPDCMVIAGWGTFATQAAIAWCLARRVPFVLLLEERDKVDHVDGNGRWQRAFVEAAVRNAAAVLVAGPADGKSTIGNGVRKEREERLPEVTVAAAERVRSLARSAWTNRSTRPSLAITLASGAMDLRGSRTRRARTRRTRSALVDRRG